MRMLCRYNHHGFVKEGSRRTEAYHWQNCGQVFGFQRANFGDCCRQLSGEGLWQAQDDGYVDSLQLLLSTCRAKSVFPLVQLCILYRKNCIDLCINCKLRPSGMKQLLNWINPVLRKISLHCECTEHHKVATSISAKVAFTFFIWA